jgi:hypothetical protein
LIGAVADFDDPAFMGDRWAGAYDDLTFGPDPALAVEFLAALADGGSRVLELGIGGGRVALPLACRGMTVEGTQASVAVLGRFRATPEGERSRSPWATWPTWRWPGRSAWCTWCGAAHLPSQRARRTASAT